MALTQYQQLELIRVLTGERIRLGRYESVRACKIEDESIVLVMNRVKYREGKQADTLTAEGMVAYQWVLVGTRWKMQEPLESWSKPSSHSIEHFHGKTWDETVESHRWATLCYRPGTSRSPLDGDDIRSKPLMKGY